MVASSSIENSASRWPLVVAVAVSLATVEGYTIAVPLSKPLSTGFSVLSVSDTGVKISPPKDDVLDPFDELPSNMSLIKPSRPCGVTSTQQPCRATYDLGLGKNAPVTHSSGSNLYTAESDSRVLEATKYWSEYESVREFPSPQSQQVVAYRSAVPETNKKMRKTVLLHPKRTMQDSLTIVPNAARQKLRTSTGQPVPMMVQSDASQLDVNSVWVEMLIHSEQQKQENELYMHVG
ncbi:expressed unknown protein [Seminavis robusta]|uniref:Uncharacterized protein n=1 Tax=Seminavis robusta TaxID=568900 RepID=A0A9N8DHD3_9STRA|nr:expressed unknown protein [Seminavis robusta]|eukprot:Sro89_g046911.1  (235) ;mRNA; r:53478-54182